MQQTIICAKWGKRYPALYVNTLWSMIKRNTNRDTRLICFTDDPSGVNPAISTYPIPEINLPMPAFVHGWRKITFWASQLEPLRGDVLFLDLDVVVVGSLAPFFSVGSPDQVILARNPVRPLERLGQTSVYRFPVGKLVPLQEAFCADPQGVADRYEYEQRFVTRNAPGGVTFFPNAWVRHIRHHCKPPFPLNYFMTARLPKDARIVIFPGGFHPEHAIAGGSRQNPGRGIRDYLAEIGKRLKKQSAFAYLRSFTKPVRWVEKHWRE